MKKTFILIFGLFLAVEPAMAEGVFDWWKAPSTRGFTNKTTAPKDAARLLTLEPRESEMYPALSPNGRFMLSTVRHGHKNAWVSQRYVENGDPANRITDDIRALDSAAWRDAEHVYFLSERAGGLGLWEKIADGEVLRRVSTLRGKLTQPILLADDTLIVVRLTPNGAVPTHQKVQTDAFDNWHFPGYRTDIVRINKDGSEHVLSEGVTPSLSPDGQWIVFSMSVGRSMHLFRMRTNGADLMQMTDVRSVDVQPSWSRDGHWIIFTSNRSHADMRKQRKSDWDIWAIDLSGRHLTQLTLNPARDGGAKMGADGRIYFHSDRPVSKKMRESHQVSGSTNRFHIWTIAWVGSEGVTQ